MCLCCSRSLRLDFTRESGSLFAIVGGVLTGMGPGSWYLILTLDRVELPLLRRKKKFRFMHVRNPCRSTVRRTAISADSLPIRTLMPPCGHD